MKLKLTKPLVFFDIEATGLNLTSDRIVEMSMLKLMPDETTITKNFRVNPQVPISREAARIHGISDEDVKDLPPFASVAQEVVDFLKGCDLAGYNLTKFDIPMLLEEILRVNIDFDFRKSKTIDVQVIFFKKEPRNLSAAYKFYCKKDLENAHAAEADTIATFEVLMSQLDTYEDLGDNVDSLSKFTSQTNFADFAGRLIYDSKNNIVINFGKHKGQQLTAILAKEPGYYRWIMDGDFPLYTKRLITQVYLSSTFGKTNMK
jgi:DNA polymerase-3 subunit epsilon